MLYGVATTVAVVSYFFPQNWFVMMQYLAWRVLAGLNRRIDLSFMVDSHTLSAPYWAFVLLKQKFKKMRVGCLDDLERVVNDSATVNHAQLVGREDGTVIVCQYNWSEYFATYFRKQALKGINHLVFSADSPGQV